VPASRSEQAGWFQSLSLQEFGTGTTPSAPLRWLHIVFMAQPPLLI